MQDLYHQPYLSSSKSKPQSPFNAEPKAETLTPKPQAPNLNAYTLYYRGLNNYLYYFGGPSYYIIVQKTRKAQF